MPTTHYADAGHSEPFSEDASDTIELASLEELVITPDGRHHNKHDDFEHNGIDSEDDTQDRGHTYEW